MGASYSSRRKGKDMNNSQNQKKSQLPKQNQNQNQNKNKNKNKGDKKINEYNKHYNKTTTNETETEIEMERVKLVTLGEIRVMQAKILELVSVEKFQEDVCAQITEELQLYMEKHSGIVTTRLTHKIEANMDNVEMRIVNAVIANVSQHVMARLEGKIVAMEERLTKAANNEDANEAAAEAASNLLTPVTPRKMMLKEKEE